MKIYAESISGYLQKASGISYQDALQQDPSAWVGGDLLVGQRYWETAKPPTQNWAIWRSFISFDTSCLKGRTVKRCWLVLRVKEKGAGLAAELRVFSHGRLPWGDTLDPDDWSACDRNEGTLYPEGLRTEVWKSIEPAAVDTSGRTQFRIWSLGEILEPTDDEFVRFYGPDSEGRPYLMIDTGNVNDDVCQNLKEVLEKHQAELGVNAIRGELLQTVPNPPEIQISWETTSGGEGELQRITATIYWVATGTPASIDQEPRQKADLIRRILLQDQTCNGYCTGIESITEELADNILWGEKWYMGAIVTVVYRRALGDMELV